jgi:hypothetical protein
MRLSRSVIGVGLALVVFALPAFAQPICGRKDCREEIAACVASECGGLSGAARAGCKRDCVQAVRAACDEDAEICHPAVTTTTSEVTTTTSEVTSTTEATTTTVEETTTTSTTLIGSPSGGFVQ